MALSKANRLRSRQDFNVVYRKGRRRKSSCLTIVVLRHLPLGDNEQRKAVTPNSSIGKSSLQPSRLGISISQKVSKRAVVRNRLKRWLKVAARSLLPKFATGWDIVVIVHPEATQCDYRQFLQELEQLLINAEVCDGH